MWKLVSPFVPEATRKKTGIFRKGFLPELLKVIDIDVLPPCYGGTEGGREGGMEGGEMCTCVLQRAAFSLAWTYILLCVAWTLLLSSPSLFLYLLSGTGAPLGESIEERELAQVAAMGNRRQP